MLYTVNLTIDDPKHGQKVEATTSIRRVQGVIDLPRHLGIMFYEKILEHIADITNEKGFSITHIVTRGSDSLTQERWNEIFVPVLERSQYQRLREGVWKHDYTPVVEKFRPI